MIGKAEEKVIRPGNPFRYGSRSVTSVLSLDTSIDAIDHVRFVDNPRTVNSNMEMTRYHLDERYLPYVTAFLLRDVIVEAFLQKDRPKVIDEMEWMGEMMEMKPGPVLLFKSLYNVSSRQSKNYHSINRAISSCSFPLSRKNYKKGDKDFFPESMLKVIENHGLFKEEIEERCDFMHCNPTNILSYRDIRKEREIPIYRGSFFYIPRCISDGRYREVEEVSIRASKSDLFNTVMKAGKIENLEKDGLPSLKSLSLMEGNIEKIEGLASHGNSLSELYVADNKIVTLDGIESLEKLETLHASYNRLKNIDALSRTVNLKNVGLENNRITSIPDLRNTKISYLNLESNKIDKLPPPDYFPITFRKLDLAGNDIEMKECMEYGNKLGKKLDKNVDVTCTFPDYE
jgi:Leucine-rich repeat (LRR) protein